MDTQTVTVLLGGGAGVFGAAVGGAATLWATTLQHRRAVEAELEREQRAEDRGRREVAEQRTLQAAATCDGLMRKAFEELSNWATDDAPSGPSTIDVMGDEAAMEAVFIPVALRTRLEEASLVLRHRNDLGRAHYSSSLVTWAAGVMPREYHSATASWVRSRSLPPRSAEWCEFVLVAEKVEEHFEEMWEQHRGSHEYSERQNAWRKRNWAGLERIARRGEDHPTKSVRQVLGEGGSGG